MTPLRRSARLATPATNSSPDSKKRKQSSSKKIYDTPTTDTSSPRAFRHFRRHPSVFDDQDQASTSYLPSTRKVKKENQNAAIQLKGKGKQRAVNDGEESSSDLECATVVTRSRTRSQQAPALEPLKSEPEVGRRLRSASFSPVKIMSKKRKRAESEEKTSKKKSKTVGGEPSVPPYSSSFLGPIPTLVVTPPSPPNSPPLPPIPTELEPTPIDIDEPPAPFPPFSSSSDQTQPAAKPKTKRLRRRPRSEVTVFDKPPETLWKNACKERMGQLKLYYLDQLHEYETDLAYQFFETKRAPSSLSISYGYASSSQRPQSPTWHYALHWRDRLHNAGDWDGIVQDKHPSSSPPPWTLSNISYPSPPPQTLPTSLPPSMFTLSSPSDANNAEGTGNDTSNGDDMDLDFRTEDCFPFELEGSDEENEELFSEEPDADADEVTNSDESEDSEESDDLSSMEVEIPVQGEGELQLTLPAYTQTPSSLAEALTPVTSENSTTREVVFALPPPHTPRKLEGEYLSADAQDFAPLPSSQSPLPTNLSSLSPLEMPSPLPLPPPHLSTLIPKCSSDEGPSLAPGLLPVFPNTHLEPNANLRLQKPVLRVFNYASKTLGIIGKGTPADMSKRRGIVEWLEGLSNGNGNEQIEEDSDGTVERIGIGSSAWYAMRFPESVSSNTPVPSSLSDWSPMPLTVHSEELGWMEVQNASVSSFQQESLSSSGTNFNSGHGSTSNAASSSSLDISEMAPAMDIEACETLSDEDAEGDIDPDVPATSPIPAHTALSLTPMDPMSSMSQNTLDVPGLSSHGVHGDEANMNVDNVMSLTSPSLSTGVGMSFNVGMGIGVSVGFGMGMGGLGAMGTGNMGINFDMNMSFGMGMGIGGIGFPALESDSWFLPGSSPVTSPPIPVGSGSGSVMSGESEFREHVSAFGGNDNSSSMTMSMYSADLHSRTSAHTHHHSHLPQLPQMPQLPDHPHTHTHQRELERFGSRSPGSPESAYPLGYAMG
jgi:hypothetical protein